VGLSNSLTPRFVLQFNPKVKVNVMVRVRVKVKIIIA
jgi:hypothetical protein